MSEFLLYFNIGLKHVLDINAYDHVLFLMALVIPFAFKDWKKVLILVSLFTLGHTIALILSVYGVVRIDAVLVEFLIPITILITAVFYLFTAGKSSKNESITFVAVITLFFGIIHGLGFSNYFNSILAGSPGDKLVPLLEFALGIEVAQIAVVIAVLLLSFLIQYFIKNSKKNWIIITSSIIIGVVIPMLIESDIWKK